MQNDGNNNGLDTEGNNTSITPLGDDSVESLTIAPSPELHKKPSDSTDGDLDNGNLNDETGDSKPALDKRPITGFYKDQASDSSDDILDDNVVDEGVIEDEYLDEELSDVRVANMNEDLDAIELEFETDDGTDGEFVSVESAEQLSRDENLFALLRRYSSLTLDNRAARKRTSYLLLAVIILSALVIVLVYAFTLYPKTVYIATKDNSAICEVLPQDNPYLTDLAISEFGRDGILSLYSINFTNWQEQTDRVFDEYFTSDGRIRTIEALKQSGLIAYVDNNALSLRANSTKTSHVESKGFFPNGDPYWTVSFPFVVEVYSGREKEPIQIRQYVATARVVVDRASANNPKGLGIDAVTLFEPKK